MTGEYDNGAEAVVPEKKFIDQWKNVKRTKLIFLCLWIDINNVS